MNLKREVALSSNGGRVVDEDVCMEILLRLPIKSVTKFQTVCKQWLSLISSDHFRRLHTLRHHQPPPCIILRTLEQGLFHLNLKTEPTTLIPFSINIPRNSSDFTIFSSCNGLLLVQYNHNCCHVYNPITKQSRKICLSPTDSLYCVEMLHLVFDPSKSLHYKVICIRAKGASFSGPNDTRTYKMEIFDSENGEWKDSITLSSSVFAFTYSIYCNNNIYGIDYTSATTSLYCVDIDKKVVRFLTSPRMPQGVIYDESIQEWNGCLYYSAHSGHSAFLWEKSEEEEDKWSLKLEERLPLPVEWCDTMLLKFVLQTSTLLILVPPTKIVAYSLIDKTYKELLEDDTSLQIPCDDDHSILMLLHQTLAPEYTALLHLDTCSLLTHHSDNSCQKL